MVNAFFNSNLYLARNPDLVAAGLHTEDQLWEHYVTYGAQESIDDENRAPNDWFNVEYYLGNYPDLVDAGITAGQALNHYFEYGINEGRSFNPSLQPSQFDAETYAADNKDVREAFGIEEDAELTAQDKANLLKHFLSYGYAEGREGAGKAFEDTVIALNEVTVYSNQKEILGTISNDLFAVDTTLVAEAVIDGLGGTDTVEFKTAATETGDNAVTLRSIENVVVDDVAVTAKVASKLDSLKLKGTAADVALDFTAAAVAASDDVLNVDVADAGAKLTVNGFETVNVAFGAKFDGTFALTANEVAGSSQTVNLSGAKESVALTFDNNGSTKLTDLTINGADLAKGLGKVTIDGQAQGIKNVTVKGSSSEANEFDVADVVATQNLTVVGGDKADTFNPTAAIDTLTGGRGNDTFDFTNSANAVVGLDLKDEKVTGIDTITDFKKGDVLKVTAATIEAVSKTGADSGAKSLEDWIKGAGAEYNAFNLDGAGYIVLNAGNTTLKDAQVVKLVGVDVTKLSEDTEAGGFVL